ncbi:MAG TPA: aminotransferase class I/II-fold pyridoxal phosphate-dependent enzyme, partial [Rhodanobacteraceae bacterium]
MSDRDSRIESSWQDFDASALASQTISGLRAYDPGHDLPALRERFGATIAELGSNENPLGPSPLAIEAMHRAVGETFRYPDPRGLSLKNALAAHLGVAVDRIALGNGSHELLMLLAQCFADPTRSIVFSQYGFAVFPIATAATGAVAVRVPALPRTNAQAPYGHDLEAIAKAVRADTQLVYLANPNNPTGTWFDDAALDRFFEHVPRNVLIVVDEAYSEYVDAPGTTSALRLAHRRPNLIVTRTFSKAYALAGLRVGYLVAHPSVVAVIERLRESFNVNNIGLAAAEAALSDRAYLADMRAFNRTERAWLSEMLKQRGYDVLPSQTNFVMIDLGRD